MEIKLKSLSKKEYQNVANDAFRIIKSTFVSRTKKFDGKFYSSFYNSLISLISNLPPPDKMAIMAIILHQNMPCEYSLELPQWGNSSENSQGMFWCKNKYLITWTCID